MNTKKTKKTKARLLNAVRLIIAKGEKASVSSITKKAKLAYGTFYRYFKDLDEIYYESDDSDSFYDDFRKSLAYKFLDDNVPFINIKNIQSLVNSKGMYELSNKEENTLSHHRINIILG